MATKFGTEHHELTVRPDAATLLPQLVYHYNEPFADSSALPAWCLSEMARRQVTVALSGDGGDESFLGYDRYAASILAAKLDLVPRPLRRLAARGAGWLVSGSARSTTTRVRRFVSALAADPVRRYGRWLSVTLDEQKQELYTRDFARQSRGTGGAGDHGDNSSLRLLEQRWAESDATSDVEKLAHTDIVMYLPDDLLVKMDIASMAHSLEVRSPLLDHHVVEFAARLPVSMKLRGRTSKYLLKQVMATQLPPAVLDRPKAGFGVPLDDWFRGSLRDTARDVLLGKRATERGYFEPATVRRYLDDHANGRAQHHTRLWSLLMLELWHRTFIDRRGEMMPALPLS